MISAVRKLQSMHRMSPRRADKLFFYITDLCHLTAEDWAKLYSDFDHMTLEERKAILREQRESQWRYD
ncbi:MAG: hypothetical protein IJM68_01100 [Synergistaceae bacterium]|nr:hypothetical protein [Synergistaceae bacterium]